MQRHENVDIIEILRGEMERNTAHYRSDFQYDIQMIQDAANMPDGENNFLLWLSRPSGTECFVEREAYLSETYASHAWRYYAGTSDTILAYAVEITGMAYGVPIGNLYALDYQRHVEQLTKDMVQAVTVKLRFGDGAEKEYPYHKYQEMKNRLWEKHGPPDHFRYVPEDEDALRLLLNQARRERRKQTLAQP